MEFLKFLGFSIALAMKSCVAENSQVYSFLRMLVVVDGKESEIRGSLRPGVCKR